MSQNKKNKRKQPNAARDLPKRPPSAAELPVSAPDAAEAAPGVKADAAAERVKRLFRDPVFVVFMAIAALTALYDLAFAVTSAVFFISSASTGFLPENFMPLAVTAMVVNAVTLIYAVVYPKIRLK